jgi:hypothetical protein
VLVLEIIVLRQRNVHILLIFVLTKHWLQCYTHVLVLLYKQ